VSVERVLEIMELVGVGLLAEYGGTVVALEGLPDSLRVVLEVQRPLRRF
jgi:hypothetical protein